MKSRALKFLLPVLVLGVVAAILYRGKMRSVPEPDFYSGVVEATEHDLAFERPGVLASLEVDEGDQVTSGQLLARLDTREIEARLAASTAARDRARAQLKTLQAGSRPQEIATVQSRLDKARAELDRLRNGATAPQLAGAQAQMNLQRETYRKIEGGFRAEDIEAAQALRDAARFEMETAEAEQRRSAHLLAEGAIAKQQLEQAQNRFESARGKYLASAENLRKLQSGYQPEDRAVAYQGYRAAQAGYEDLAQGTRPELIAAAQAEVGYWESQLSLSKEGPRREEIEAGKATLDQSQAEIQALKVQLSKSRLTTPVAGVVTARPFESGETVAAGPAVFTVTELEKPWVAVFVPETEIGQVKLGDLCTVTVDSLPDEPIEGRVIWVSANAEFTPRFIQTERQRVDLVFRVKVEVDNPGLKLKPGMPADVKMRSSQPHV